MAGGIPDANFSVTYDPEGGRGQGSVTISHTGGHPIPADQLSIRTSDGDAVFWNELGTTEESATDVIREGATARIDATVLNWPSDIGRNETVLLVFVAEDGSPTTLARFNPGAESSTLEAGGQGFVIDDFEDGDVSDWTLGPTTTSEEWVAEEADTPTAGDYRGKLSTNDGNDWVSKTVDPVRPTSIGFWVLYEGRVNSQDHCLIKLMDSVGNHVLALGYDWFDRELTIAEQGSRSGYTVATIYEIDASVHKVELRNIDWQNGTYSFELLKPAGDDTLQTLNSFDGVQFRDDRAREFSKLRMDNYNIHSNAPFYIDNITAVM